MRKYLVPAIVCAAIGLVVFLFLNRAPPARRPTPPKDTTRNAPPETSSILGKPAETRTRLDEHRWLREFERALLEGKIDEAHYFRQKLCEDISTILASEKLTRDMLETIKEVLETDDLKKRDVVLGLLRVVEHPEATQIIADEYYRARNEDEQMTLLEAMSHPYHDSKQASVWSVDKALNSESAEHRERAFDVMRNYCVDSDILSATAMQIYDGTTENRMRETVVKVASEKGRESSTGREFIRRVMRNPKGDDMMMILPSIANWADEKDAARLEELANQLPDQALILREQARLVRRARMDERRAGEGKAAEIDHRRELDERNRRAEEEERKKRDAEAEGAGGETPPEHPETPPGG